MTGELREPTYLLLTAAASGWQHGHGLMQEISALSEGRVVVVVVRAGTFCTARWRLLGQSLVETDGE